MPELPEVETMRRDLQALADQAVIVGVQVLDPKVIAGDPRRLASRLKGRRLVRFDRRGKVLMIALDSGDTLLGHPRMTGRLLGLAPNAPLPPHARVVLHLDAGRRLVFDDIRRFGRLELVEGECLDDACLLRNIGEDALACDPVRLRASLQRRKIPVKVALLDQRAISGIGNIYASEILFHCGLDPRTPACRLTAQEVCQVARETERVLAEGIEFRGTTISDYRTPTGESGGYQRRLRVYGREDEPCLREGCAGTIKRIVLGGRSTYYCTDCQRTGRTRRSS